MPRRDGKYYHYTDKKGIDAILDSERIKMTPANSRYAHFGKGSYWTRIPPCQGTKAVLQNNYDYTASGPRNPDTGTKADYWVEVDADDLKGLKKSQDTLRSVYVYPKDLDLRQIDYDWGATEDEQVY